MKTLLGNLVSGVCGAVLVIAVQFWVTSPGTQAGGKTEKSNAEKKDEVVECVRAEKLVIVDKKGVERICLSIDPEGNLSGNGARITAYDANGERRAELCGHDKGGNFWAFGDKNCSIDCGSSLVTGGAGIEILSQGTLLTVSGDNIVLRKQGKVVWVARQ